MMMEKKRDIRAFRITIADEIESVAEVILFSLQLNNHLQLIA